eukprot:CAMPEP_0113944518 /NCGR_PEP_ID=MMETSP1339-20121228/34472_1 /TAXON_ID=94617 /ORGANISM="Fibrocapsa japonica" /LENGTH=134 /DNA_ID=CAMNT_0000949745 /DNA_START=239 /DNA_END=643 /DNA_ORIENTATION=+ /assembly_acc=CAM_ASM_000762
MASNFMNPLFMRKENFIIAQSEESGSTVGFGQIRSVPASGAFELASLYVEKDFRKKKIGKRLCQALLEKFQGEHSEVTLYALTLTRTSPFFEKLGFVESKDITTIPAALRIEMRLGSVLAKIVKGKVTCLELDV